MNKVRAERKALKKAEKEKLKTMSFSEKRAYYKSKQPTWKQALNFIKWAFVAFGAFMLVCIIIMVIQINTTDKQHAASPKQTVHKVAKPKPVADLQHSEITDGCHISIDQLFGNTETEFQTRVWMEQGMNTEDYIVTLQKLDNAKWVDQPNALSGYFDGKPLNDMYTWHKRVEDVGTYRLAVTIKNKAATIGTYYSDVFVVSAN